MIVLKFVLLTRLIHPAGMVLPFSRGACNVAAKIGDCMYLCWRFRVFCSKYNVIFFPFPDPVRF